MILGGHKYQNMFSGCFQKVRKKIKSLISSGDRNEYHSETKGRNIFVMISSLQEHLPQAI